MVFKVFFAYPASFCIVCLLLISEKLLIVRLYIYIYIYSVSSTKFLSHAILLLSVV